MVAPGQVVVLNGTSSSGKTSTATAFHEARSQAGECWVVVGLDAVRCDVDVAAQRELARSDRALGLVRGQADAVHRFPAYDLELDTTHVAVAEVARQLDEFVANLGPSGPSPRGDTRTSHSGATGQSYDENL